jgi:hypothetical protein
MVIDAALGVRPHISATVNIYKALNKHLYIQKFYRSKTATSETAEFKLEMV